MLEEEFDRSLQFRRSMPTKRSLSVATRTDGGYLNTIVPRFQLISASQHVVQDAVVSNKHFRVYTVIFDDDQSDGIPPLVYAEDLSRNGTYWNGSLIGKGNGGVLLSDGDTLRISTRIHYRFFQAVKQNEEQPFDLTQECEMKVRGHGQTWV